MKASLTKVWVMMKKEWRTYLTTPALYIALLVYIGVWQYVFYRTVFVVGEASVRTLFDLLPWFLAVAAPALTMGSFIQEKEWGTIEIVMTHRVRIVELLLAKWLSAWTVLILTLLVSLPPAIAFSWYAPFDWGLYAGQLLSGILCISVLTGIGILTSIILPHYIAALLTGIFTALIVLLSGTESIGAAFPLTIAAIVERLSLLSHSASLARGVIRLTDIFYGIGATGIVLTVSYGVLRHQFISKRVSPITIKLSIFWTIFLGLSIFSQQLPFRLDVTQDQRFSLSPSSQTILKQLDTPVTVTLYRSRELPNQLLASLREIADFLYAFDQQSNQISLKTVYVDAGSSQAQEAISKGIREVQFNVLGTSEFQIKTGFLGIHIQANNQEKVIPFIQRTEDIEYQVSGLIRELTLSNKPILTIFREQRGISAASDVTLLANELGKQFTIELVDAADELATHASRSSLLVVHGSQSDAVDILKGIEAFLSENKAVIVLTDSYTVQLETATATPRLSPLNPWLTQIGISVPPELVYDLRSHETVSLGSGPFGVLTEYPFWVIAQSTGIQDMVLQGLPLIAWGSPVRIDTTRVTQAGYIAQPILQTTAFGGVEAGSVSVSPDRSDYVDAGLSTVPLAVRLTPQDQATRSGELVVVGDSDLISDYIVQNAPQNIAFFLRMVELLVNDDMSVLIPRQQLTNTRLFFPSPLDPLVIKYGSLTVTLAVPMLIGIWWYIRRRRIKQKKYTTSV